MVFQEAMEGSAESFWTYFLRWVPDSETFTEKAILLALDGNIVGRQELSPLTPKDSFQVLPGIMAK